MIFTFEISIVSDPSLAEKKYINQSNCYHQIREIQIVILPAATIEFAPFPPKPV